MEEITGNSRVVILGSIHNCGPGAVVWLLAVKRLHLHTGVYLASLQYASLLNVPFDAAASLYTCTCKCQLV